jgi:hypothetical protein
MKYVLDFNNTGFITDGFLTINTEKNELGYPDGTRIVVSKYDENEKLIAQKEIDVEDLF